MNIKEQYLNDLKDFFYSQMKRGLKSLPDTSKIRKLKNKLADYKAKRMVAQ